MTDARADALADELVEARAAFLEAVAGLPDEPGPAGAWGLRELIAHVGYWAGQATEAIHRVESGEADAFDLDAPGVDERNATVARVARESSAASVRSRERAAAEALIARLRDVEEPDVLTVRLPNGRTLEEEVRLHGPAHYRGHAEEER